MNRFFNRRFLKLMMLFAAGSVSIGLTGCGPPQLEKSEEVKPNETAFVIPMENQTKDGQGKFQSVEFLEQHKVAAKRIILGQRKRDTGRAPWDYEWITTDRVVKVERTPLTREWTEKPTSGTSSKNEALEVESLDSINFALGATITCSIKEEDTAKFLYFYSSQQLAEILDSNLRGYVQTVLAREFGKYNLTEGMKKKAEIFDLAFKETKALFAEKGITVDYLGSTAGLHYSNDEIQQAIDRKFKAEQDIETARQEKLAQDMRNAKLIASAKAEAEAANLLAEAKEAVTMKIDLEIRKTQVEAMLEAAKRWNGQMPASIMPQGTNMLFGLDLPRAPINPSSK